MIGTRTVIHAATLHKPHIESHRAEDFVETNVSGTLILLEEAVRAGVRCFIFTSTTSAFGAALIPPPGEPAAWISEDVAPIPKNIYGVTKVSAESLCELFSRTHSLPTVVLRTSRFFPEPDDDIEISSRYALSNVQANEMLYRRVDLEDAVSAHHLAIDRAERIGFGKYIVSATTPFTRADLAELRIDAPKVVKRLFPDFEALYRELDWQMFPRIERIYANDRARSQLQWNPKYDFAYVLECLRERRDFRSPLAREVGSKGYHKRYTSSTSVDFQ